MISLVLAMLWSRRGQAATLALLSLFGVAAAVAAPAYLRAADRAVAANQVRIAPPGERSLQLYTLAQDHRADEGVPSSTDVDLSSTGSALFDMPGFQYVYAVEYATVGLDPDDHVRTRFVYRQGVCQHVTIVAGRCLAGESDVLLGEQTAKAFGVKAGDSISLTYAVHTPGTDPIYVPQGRPKVLLVAGLYRVPAPGEVYWGQNSYFSGGSAAHPDEPALVGYSSLDSMDKGAQQITIDGYAGPGALDVDRLPAVRSGLTHLNESLSNLGPAIELTTGLTALLGRIDQGRAAAHRIVPVLAVCLVLLACLTIYLAVGYGTEGRRPELAVVALRGARWGQRWWLATGENLMSIVIGAVMGCLVGQLIVNAFAAWRFAGVGADAGLSSLRWAPVAAGAAVLTAIAAERRQLTRPVAELLRRVPAAASAAGAIAAEIVVVLLAAVAVVQLRLTKGSLTGVGTFAAALVVIAAALVAARLLLPWATATARRALNRGRPGAALAGFQLSRRVGAVRLVGLLTAAVAVVTYAAIAIDVGARDRSAQAALGTGASRVLTVAPVSRPALLDAVRAADPTGEYAMAVVRLPVDNGHPPVIAVDSQRLAAVADWPGDGGSARRIAARLHPATAAGPVVLRTGRITFDVTAAAFAQNLQVTLTAVVSPAGQLADVQVPMGVMRPGRHTYEYDVPACAAGCQLDSLRIEGGVGAIDVAGKLTLNDLGGGTDGALADPAHWRAEAGGTVGAAPDGLLIDVTSLNNLPTGMLVEPADMAYPLPAVIAGGATPESVSGLDGRSVRVHAVAGVAAVPGIGRPAVLVDLEYASRLAADGGQSTGEVWLAPGAPSSIEKRLGEHGLVVTGDVTEAAARARLDGQGPALALWFYGIVAILATALAAGALVLAAGVDRSRRVEDLSALRAQGLSRGAVRTATLWTYPVLVAVAVVAGVLIALASWWLTGWALPLTGVVRPALPLPGAPHVFVPIGAGLAVLVILTGVAVITGRRTLSRIR